MMKRIVVFTGIFFFVLLSITFAAEEVEHATSLPLITIIPFIVMLLCIAIIPLIKEHWWENNWNKLIISCILGIPMGIYILFHDYIELLETMEEYLSFIIYVGSLLTLRFDFP